MSDDDIFNIAEQLLEMTEMTEKEKARFIEAVDHLMKLRQIDDFRDLDQIDFEFEEIDPEQYEDFNDLVNELVSTVDNVFGDNIDIDTEDFTAGNVPEEFANFFDDRNDFRYNPPEEEEVNIEIDEDDIENKSYHGETWMEIKDGFETFIDIPEDKRGDELNITLEDGEVSITGSVDQKIETTQLPREVDSVGAEVKESTLIIRVY